MNESVNWNRVAHMLAQRFSQVELLALSGRVHDEAAYQRAVARLGNAFPVVGAERTTQPVHRFAAADGQRQAWLDGLQACPERALLLGVRGGYGMTRLLQDAPLAQIAERLLAVRAVLCGHSDFTALQTAILATCLRESLPVPALVQGPMLCVDWGPENGVQRTMDDFLTLCDASGAAACTQVMALDAVPESVLNASLSDLWVNADDTSPIDFSGPACHGLLWGGNLSMVAALAGTRFCPVVDDGLLFVEDVNEHPYRIERMLLQLHHAGVLERQQALLVGQCTDWKASPLDHGYGLNEALAYIQRVSGVPVFVGLRFGHVADRLSLPVGRLADLTRSADGCRAQLTYRLGTM